MFWKISNLFNFRHLLQSSAVTFTLITFMKKHRASGSSCHDTSFNLKFITTIYFLLFSVLVYNKVVSIFFFLMDFKNSVCLSNFVADCTLVGIR